LVNLQVVFHGARGGWLDGLRMHPQAMNVVRHSPLGPLYGVGVVHAGGTGLQRDGKAGAARLFPA